MSKYNSKISVRSVDHESHPTWTTNQAMTLEQPIFLNYKSFRIKCYDDLNKIGRLNGSFVSIMTLKLKNMFFV